MIAQSRAGMAATVIQSTGASRPIRVAKSWLTMVEKVLLLRPSSIAACPPRTSSPPGGEKRQTARSRQLLELLQRIEFARLVVFFAPVLRLGLAVLMELLIPDDLADGLFRLAGDPLLKTFRLAHGTSKLMPLPRRRRGNERRSLGFRPDGIRQQGEMPEALVRLVGAPMVPPIIAVRVR
ncbi:hypothetical protein IVB18_11785 [Bradyrhizobium sp. 186]|nr:hypothetical protein [Bradyrhizobium sp. 186]UPK37914.1 hypothetical protein IVB18_11785 [Bradyrhizobium sp. 186]